jgi:hypothetical protein
LRQPDRDVDCDHRGLLGGSENVGKAWHKAQANLARCVARKSDEPAGGTTINPRDPRFDWGFIAPSKI